jgi:heme-degrading monooxygenase HmoA
MIWKLIRAAVKDGCRDEFLRRQRIWNDAMSRQPGFRSVQVATDPADPRSVTILIVIESLESLDRFMHGEHDALFAATQMGELYERLDVRVLDVVEPGA